MSGLTEFVPSFGLGFALGAAPGPVQVLILSETARRGISGGLRVMLGANSMLLLVMIVLALGFSSFAPSDAVLRGLRVAGGLFIGYLGVSELRTIRTEAGPTRIAGDAPGGNMLMGPTARGVLFVVLNPGAWIFFATTASALVADATGSGGRDAALLVAVAVAAGVSCSDLMFTLLGSGGRVVLGDERLRWIRAALSVALIAIGAIFLWQGVLGGV